MALETSEVSENNFLIKENFYWILLEIDTFKKKRVSVKNRFRRLFLENNELLGTTFF
jgi:hypothetical protein